MSNKLKKHVVDGQAVELDKDGNPIPGTETGPQNQSPNEEKKDGFLVGVFRKIIRGAKWVDDHTPKPIKVAAGAAVIGGAMYLSAKEGYKLGVKSVKPALPTDDDSGCSDEELSELPEEDYSEDSDDQEVRTFLSNDGQTLVHTMDSDLAEKLANGSSHEELEA